jgi:hypothetical protein
MGRLAERPRNHGTRASNAAAASGAYRGRKPTQTT